MDDVSILFDHEPPPLRDTPPACFADLHLDQFVSTLLAGREEYELAPYLYTPLATVESVGYRQAVFHDLERAELRAAVVAFADGMRTTRTALERVRTLRQPLQQQRWYLEAASHYCAASRALSGAIDAVELASEGLRRFRSVLHGYVTSPTFSSLAHDAQTVRRALDAVRYTVWIRGAQVEVAASADEPDLSADVVATFERFGRENGQAGGGRTLELVEMNHVEYRVLQCVAQLHPEPFQALRDFCDHHRAFIDDAVSRFDRDVQFYLAWLENVEYLRQRGLSCCYPAVSVEDQATAATDAYDIALARNLLARGGSVVPNDLQLQGAERIVVVSGPNQGGKTTYARMVGQLHYLASLGVPIPGREARLFLPDHVYTHFEHEETLDTLRGKLEDELVRIRRILASATPKSLIVMNESFGSTTADDALYIARRVLRRVIELDALCVFVTFLDELSTLGPATISMVSTVSPDDPTTRTLRVVRRPADGLAYAAAIARRYGLTYDHIREQVG